MKRNIENEILINFFSLEKKKNSHILDRSQRNKFPSFNKVKESWGIKKDILFWVNNFRFISYNN